MASQYNTINWRVIEVQYRNYNENDTERHGYDHSGSKTVAAGEVVYGTFNIHVCPFSRTGYDFIGFRRQRSSGSWRYEGEGTSVPFTGSGQTYYDIYCQWRLKTYTVTYNANGGENAPASQTKTYGTALTLTSSVPTRENYIFQGWSTSSTGEVEYQAGGSYTTEESTTLYAIWRVAAGILTSVSDTAIGSSGVATWTKISEDHTYKLVLSLTGATSIEVNNIAAGTSSQSFTISSGWLSALPNSATASATAVLYSYNGGELVGSTSLPFTVTVPSTIKPTITAFTAVPHSSNATAESWGVAVQGHSYLTLSVTATAGTGATVSNIAFSGHGISQNSTATTGNTATITSTGALSYTVTVTDSRGRSATQNVSVTAYAYSNPNVSSMQSVRCMSDGTASDTEGNYIKVLPVFVFSSVNGNNSLTVNKIEYKVHDSLTWTNGPTSLVSGSWSSVFGQADITKTFDVRFTITDALGNTFALVTVVPSVVGFALGLKNDRARFGGPVKQAGLEIDWDVQIHGDLTLGSTTLTEAQLQALLAMI